MGCTASVLDHDQQQLWIRSQLQVSDEPVESSKTNRPKEDSLRSHKYIHEEENNNFSEEDEVLADDVLDYASKSNESEHTMYDGSYDGLSKADFSVVESIITRLGQSKSVATEDALYDDTSSESENNVPHAESHLERYLYSTPIDVDDDDDLTRVDSMIASSEAPGLVNCDESDDGISFDHLSHGDTLITSSVAPNPLHPDDNDEENINSPTQGEEITQNCISPLSKATSTQLLPRKLDISKWQAEANSKKSPTTSILYSPKRLDMSKFEKHGNQTTTKSVIRDNAVDQRSSQQKLQPKSLSPERTKLKNDINRLRQQILELEQRKKLPSTKVRGYVKPSDLVLPNSSTNVEVPIETGKHVLSDACTSTVICDAATESNHLDGECTTDGTENIVEVYTCSSLLRSTDSNTDGNDTIKFQVAVDKENQGTISICDITKNGDASKDEQLGEQRKECDRVLDDPAKISLKDDEQRRGDGDKEIDDHLKHPEKICRNDENTGSDGCVEDNGRILSEHIKVVSSERRESLDSAIMQYSVSTYGHESDFERSYDDASTQLFGSSIPKLKKNGTHDDDKQCDMMTKSISKAQVISSEIKLSESTIGMKPSNEHNNPNVIIEKQDVHPDLQSQQCDKNPDPVAYDVTKSRSGLDRIANFGGPLQSLKSVNDSIASQPKHETATHCTSFGQENSENSMARSNEVDANNRSIEATDFVHLLNLDPWNRESKLDEQQIFDMIEEKPSLCSHKYKFEGFHGFIYPLSALCALSASIAMIKRCYLAFPQAITKADAWVGTSLHYACSYHASLPIVEFLSKKHPLSLKAVNQFNRLPIHMACMFDAEPSVISYLIRKYPGGCKKADKLGLLPLHIACDSDIGVESPNISVIKLLTESYPEACRYTSEAGTTPLAISITRRVSISVLKLLVEACPESLSVKDHKNRIPLHSAVLVRAPLDVIGLLLVSYPSGLVMEDSKHETPYDYAVRLDMSTAVLDLLKPPDWNNHPKQAMKQQKLHIDQ